MCAQTRSVHPVSVRRLSSTAQRLQGLDDRGERAAYESMYGARGPASRAAGCPHDSARAPSACVFESRKGAREVVVIGQSRGGRAASRQSYTHGFLTTALALASVIREETGRACAICTHTPPTDYLTTPSLSPSPRALHTHKTAQHYLRGAPALSLLALIITSTTLLSLPFCVRVRLSLSSPPFLQLVKRKFCLSFV